MKKKERDPELVAIGQRVRNARINRGMTKEALAEAARSGLAADSWHRIVDEDVHGISGELRLAAPATGVAEAMYSQR